MDTVIHPVIVLNEYESDLAQTVGARAASRAVLRSLKIPTPKAFVVTEAAFYQCLHANNLQARWMQVFSQTKPHDVESVVAVAHELQQHIKKMAFPEPLIKAITKAYTATIGSHWAHLTISPTAHTKAPVMLPLPVIKGTTALVDFLRQVWAVQLSPHAISLHLSKNHSYIMPLPPVMVSEFEPAIASGKVHSIDPHTKDKNIIRIESIWGTNPATDTKPIPTDVHLITKDSLTFVTREYNEQTEEIVSDRFGRYGQQKVDGRRRLAPKISDETALSLCAMVKKLQNSQLKPITANWLQTKSALYVTRFEGLTLDQPVNERHIAKPASLPTVSVLARGIATSPGIVTAPLTRYTKGPKSYLGQIVYLEEPSIPLLHDVKAAAGIVVAKNGITSEVAFTCREIGIPIIVGVGSAALPFNQMVTLDAGRGVVYQQKHKPAEKSMPQHVLSQPTETTPKVTATTIYLHVSHYDRLDESIYLKAKGVGWCRGNSLLTHQSIHPRWWITNKKAVLKQHVMEQLESISQAFGDRPVWYCLFDMDSREAAQLTHGKHYEQTEYNPSLGFRGAYRIVNNPTVTEFELDCIAELKTSRRCLNIHPVVPFVRSPEEYQVVKRLIASHKLARSTTNLIGAELTTPAAATWISGLADIGVDSLHVNLDYLSMLLSGFDGHDPIFNQLLKSPSTSLLQTMKQLGNVAHLHRLPLLVQATYLDQQKDFLKAVIEAGATAIVVNPPQYERIHEWIYDIEKHVANGKKQ